MYYEVFFKFQNKKYMYNLQFVNQICATSRLMATITTLKIIQNKQFHKAVSIWLRV